MMTFIYFIWLIVLTFIQNHTYACHFAHPRANILWIKEQKSLAKNRPYIVRCSSTSTSWDIYPARYKALKELERAPVNYLEKIAPDNKLQILKQYYKALGQDSVIKNNTYVRQKVDVDILTGGSKALILRPPSEEHGGGRNYFKYVFEERNVYDESDTSFFDGSLDKLTEEYMKNFSERKYYAQHAIVPSPFKTALTKRKYYNYYDGNNNRQFSSQYDALYIHPTKKIFAGVVDMSGRTHSDEQYIELFTFYDKNFQFQQHIGTLRLRRNDPDRDSLALYALQKNRCIWKQLPDTKNYLYGLITHIQFLPQVDNFVAISVKGNWRQPSYVLLLNYTENEYPSISRSTYAMYWLAKLLEAGNLKPFICFLKQDIDEFNQIALTACACDWLSEKIINTASMVEGHVILKLLHNKEFIKNRYKLIWRTTTVKHGNLFKQIYEKVKIDYDN